MNILYLDDYINYYSNKLKKIIIIKPYKDTLRNGFIINRNKFIKRFNELLKENKIKPSIINESIIIITNNYTTNEDKILYKEIFMELNYKKIYFENECNYLKIDKHTLYINCNYNYFYLLYINKYGNIEINMNQNTLINREIIVKFLKPNINNIMLYGKNTLTFQNIFDKKKIDYYYFENKDNLLIELIKNKF